MVSSRLGGIEDQRRVDLIERFLKNVSSLEYWFSCHGQACRLASIRDPVSRTHALDPNQGGAGFALITHMTTIKVLKVTVQRKAAKTGQLQYRVQNSQQYVTGYTDPLLCTVIVGRVRSSGVRRIFGYLSRQRT